MATTKDLSIVLQCFPRRYFGTHGPSANLFILGILHRAIHITHTSGDGSCAPTSTNTERLGSDKGHPGSN